jgi:3-dehydroquinate synthase
MAQVMDTIRVIDPRDLALSRSTKGKSCEIIIGKRLLERSGLDRIAIALLHGNPTSCVIITDSIVGKLYGSAILQSISRIAKTDLIKIPPGEGGKTFDTCESILSHLAKIGFDKDGVLILLGGGVVGDIGGFVASIYKRGVRYIQIPTTLLAQIDSSIGGKTGVDTAWGKNQIGTIYQPTGVLIDPVFLKTLPDHEILNGIGEMVKYGITSSAKIFDELERNHIESISELTSLIEPCCRIKARIVSKDPYELNVRSMLNYGHTIGHALEAASNYRMSHGISVLVGLIAEGWIAHELDLYESGDFHRQEFLIKRLLEKRKNILPDLKFRHETIAKFVLSDKKNAGGKIRMSLPEKIGKMHLNENGSFKTAVPFDLLKPSINYTKEVLSFAF